MRIDPIGAATGGMPDFPPGAEIATAVALIDRLPLELGIKMNGKILAHERAYLIAEAIGAVIARTHKENAGLLEQQDVALDALRDAWLALLDFVPRSLVDIARRSRYLERHLKRDPWVEVEDVARLNRSNAAACRTL